MRVIALTIACSWASYPPDRVRADDDPGLARRALRRSYLHRPIRVSLTAIFRCSISLVRGRHDPVARLRAGRVLLASRWGASSFAIACSSRGRFLSAQVTTIAADPNPLIRTRLAPHRSRRGPPRPGRRSPVVVWRSSRRRRAEMDARRVAFFLRDGFLPGTSGALAPDARPASCRPSVPFFLRVHRLYPTQALGGTAFRPSRVGSAAMQPHAGVCRHSTHRGLARSGRMLAGREKGGPRGHQPAAPQRAEQD